MTELKRCPNCGRKMDVDYKFCPKLKYGIRHANKYFDTFHERCYGGTSYEFDTEEEAIEAWNRRAEDK